MNFYKAQILENLCYSELVYERINKKLKSNFSKPDIEKMLFGIIKETSEKFFEKTGKNIYITNTEHHIKITVNSNTFRIITVNRIFKMQP